ncbi:MAG: T9SS type B sorting domain-containing protein [Prevotellaceae bacterium]|jgi:gliding motility-associated-like protein|nr:T9SS type B sorting domain-containing protein [Prevotellaceae bacterium]
MLKQYKRLLYILGMVVFLNLLHYPALAQGGDEPKKDTTVCKEVAMPLDLFNVLGIQISPTNGYWTDGNGKIVDNIFDPTVLDIGSYNFVFTITTENYCGAYIGKTYKVEVDIEGSTKLQAYYSYLDPAWCESQPGTLTIDSMDYGTLKYSYMLLRKGEGQNDTIVRWTDVEKLPPVVVDSTLTSGEYYLYVMADPVDGEELFGVCYTPLWSDTITLVTVGSPINIDTVELLEPEVGVDGKFTVEATGGVGELEYNWYLDKDGSYDLENPIHTGKSMITSYNNKYWLRVTDERGCYKDLFYEPKGNIVYFQDYYFFCQGNYIEMFSGLLIDSKDALASLIFSTAQNPNLWIGQGYTIKVYPSNEEGVSAEDSNNWLNEAITEGYTANNATIEKYIEVYDSKGILVKRQMITVKIFNRPVDLALNLVNSKLEWDVEDMVKFETTPADMAWYVYFLNNKLLDSIETNNIFEVSAMRFTGTVQDMMKVHVLEDVVMDVYAMTKDSTCTWVVSEPVVVNIPFPNTFTPDGDGNNDVFLGGSKFANREYHLEIINRFGHRLYYGDKGWDGTYKGTQMPSGAYYYIVHLKMEDGTTKVLKGAVTLIRKER